MKTIGLLGGMSWESTETYYRLINEGVKQRLGGLHSAKICLYSVDFEEIEQLQHTGDWPATARILSETAKRVEDGGADFLVICTNTMHKVVPEIEAAISVPILHIADAAANAIKAQSFETVGLLGTNFTMEQDFYKGRLQEKHGINVIVPETEERQFIHNVIYEELCLGEIKTASRDGYVRTIEKLAQQGAQAVMLACTEIPLLVQQEHTTVPLLDTTAIHAAQAVEHALQQ
jgi:aspartate racemase